MYKIFILLSLLFMPLSAQEYDTEDGYVFGEGVQIGSLPMYVGGYFSLDYKHTDTQDRYRLDDLAIISYGNYDKFSYMAEFEFKEFYVVTQSQNDTIVTKDTRLHTERLYGDYSLNENYMLRAGKYNSPIGYWNMLPVNVLRDTTSNPITSSIIFPQFTTGLLASYTSYTDADFKIDIMAQKNQDLDAGYNNYEVDEHFGLGLSYEKDNLSLKINAGVFNLVHYNSSNANENDDDDNDNERDELAQPERYYLHLSAKYESDSFKIMGELGTQASKHDFTTPYAGYIQGLYRLNEQNSLILRAEAYEERVLEKSEKTAIVGYTYRPLYPVALKAEYQFHSLSKNNNLLFSFSVMF